jgi:hypothetical protein
VLAGFWLKLDWFWLPELPDTFFTFAEIANRPREVVSALRDLRR